MPVERPPPAYHPGDKVWWLRPSSTSVSKLDTLWVGPARVVKRVGELSYQIEVRPDVLHDVHHDQLKPFVDDAVDGTPLELFHHTTGFQELDTEPGEWEVDKILRHGRKSNGTWESLTQWQHTDPGEATWEPASNFVTRYCVEFPEYVRKHRLDLGISDVFLDVVGKTKSL